MNDSKTPSALQVITNAVNTASDGTLADFDATGADELARGMIAGVEARPGMLKLDGAAIHRAADAMLLKYTQMVEALRAIANEREAAEQKASREAS